MAGSLTGVGHEEQPLAEVRSADPRSAKIEGPEGIALRFHVRAYNGEPSEAILARNLLAKDRYSFRFAMLDEVEEGGP